MCSCIPLSGCKPLAQHSGGGAQRTPTHYLIVRPITIATDQHFARSLASNASGTRKTRSFAGQKAHAVRAHRGQGADSETGGAWDTRAHKLPG